jgi:hypothetical protein
MKKVLFILSLLLVAVLITGCGGAKPDEVALQLAEAVNAQDLDGALALFAANAVVISVSPEPFTGKAEIQGWLEGMFADDFQLEAEILEVNGNLVTERDTMTMDSMSFYGVEPLTGTSEITVEDGLIISLSFSWSDETLAALQNAPFVAQEDLIGVWTVGTFFKFNEDGTLRVADKLADLDMPLSEEHPGSIQNWTYDGMVITLTGIAGVEGTTEGYSNCTPEDVGSYLVRWKGADLDHLRFSVIDDPCATRKMGMQWGNLKPIEP